MTEMPSILTERVDDIPLLVAQMRRMELPSLPCVLSRDHPPKSVGSRMGLLVAECEAMNESIALTTLRTFRHALYGCFERRADALLTAGPVLSPAHLSLETVHRRGWGSLYAALAAGRVNDTALRTLLSQYPLADGQPI